MEAEQPKGAQQSVLGMRPNSPPEGVERGADTLSFFYHEDQSRNWMKLNFQLQGKMGPDKRNLEWQNQVRSRGTPLATIKVAFFHSQCLPNLDVIVINQRTSPNPWSSNFFYGVPPHIMTSFELVLLTGFLNFIDFGFENIKSQHSCWKTINHSD